MFLCIESFKSTNLKLVYVIFWPTAEPYSNNQYFVCFFLLYEYHGPKI
jgi:hypothetical protein